MRLAPFYDLMCTRVYSGLGKLTPGHLVRMAQALGIDHRYLRKLGREMAEQILRAVPEAAAEVLPGLDHNHRVLSERIVTKVGSITHKMRDRLTGPVQE